MYSIGKMAKLCHTSIQTLRWYDQQKLIQPIYVNPDNHYRYYGSEQIFQFNLIKYLQTTGLNLKEIRQILQEPTLDLVEFWKTQEATIEKQITEEKRNLCLAQFQKIQANLISNMKGHLNFQPYIKTITQKVAVVDASREVTPLDQPDAEVARLDRQLLAEGQLPNLEYGFSFPLKKFSTVQEIQYQQIFKSVIFPVYAQTNLKILDLSGEYLCIDFKWTVDQYLNYLNRLVSAFRKVTSGPPQPIVYEVSYPQNYFSSELRTGANSIAELRIYLNE